MQKLNYDDFCKMYFILTEEKDKGSDFYLGHEVDHFEDFLRWYFMRYLSVYCNVGIELKTRIAFSKKASMLVQKTGLCDVNAFKDYSFGLDFEYSYNCYLIYQKEANVDDKVSNITIFTTDYVDLNLTFGEFIGNAAINYPDHILGGGEFSIFEFDVIVGDYDLKKYTLPDDVEMGDAEIVINGIKEKLIESGVNGTEVETFGVEGICAGASGRERSRWLIEKLSNFELDVLTQWVYLHDKAGGCTGRDIIVAIDCEKIDTDLKLHEAVWAVKEEKVVGQKPGFTVIPPWSWIYAIRVNRALGNNVSQ